MYGSCRIVTNINTLRVGEQDQSEQNSLLAHLSLLQRDDMKQLEGKHMHLIENKDN